MKVRRGFQIPGSTARAVQTTSLVRNHHPPPYPSLPTPPPPAFLLDREARRGLSGRTAAP